MSTALTATVAAREVAQARREEGAIAHRMQPSPWEAIRPVLSPLFRLGMANDRMSDEEAAEEATMRLADLKLTCAGEPLWAIKETVAAFVTGRAGKGFCPNSAEFGKELRLRTEDERTRWTQARRRCREVEALAAEEAVARQPISDEARRIVNETLARMEARAAEMRSKPLAPTAREHGPSPAARIAEETAARAAARDTHA